MPKPATDIPDSELAAAARSTYAWAWKKATELIEQLDHCQTWPERRVLQTEANAYLLILTDHPSFVGL